MNLAEVKKDTKMIHVTLVPMIAECRLLSDKVSDASRVLSSIVLAMMVEAYGWWALS